MQNEDTEKAHALESEASSEAVAPGSLPDDTVARWAKFRKRAKESALSGQISANAFVNVSEWKFGKTGTITVGESWAPHLVYLDSLGVPSASQGVDALDAHQEHEKTRELISEKLSDLAQKQDIITAKEEIIESLNARIQDLENCLRQANEELVRVRDLEQCANRLCEQIRCENDQTRGVLHQELADLRRYLSKFAPHRRFFRVTFGFFCFFSLTMLANSALGVRIVEPFWNAVGIILTAAMLVVIYFGMKDVQSQRATSEKR